MGYLITGKNDLKTWCLLNGREELLNEWDYSKNEDLTPSEVAYGSNKKRNWICSKGHTWLQSPNARALRNHNCPYCSNHMVWSGYNDLATLNPELAKEWNYKKNALQPSEVTINSGKKVWWVCDKGHEWEATVCDRSEGGGCPYCSNRKIIKGFNDIATTHPEIVKEWDFEKNSLSPYEVSYGSPIKIWWKCSEGHSFQQTVNNRIGNKNKCPYCSNKKVFSGFNDFETWCINNHQEILLDEWDFDNKLKPSEVSAYSHMKVSWICSMCKDRWFAAISTRTRHLEVFGCKKCATKQAKLIEAKEKAKNGLSLRDIYPQITLEWDYEKNQELKPNEILPGSNRIVWWKCPKGHSYRANVNRRTGLGTGCPICVNKEVLKGYNDLETTNPSLVEEWDKKKNLGVLPSEVVANSHLSVWWKCKECGNEWKAIISSRTRGTGCPRCAREYSSSFPEQVLYFYLNKIYPDAINGDRHLDVELDIYVPSCNIAFEYDGSAWHKSFEKDIKKNNICEMEGIKLYRIRERKCPSLPISENCIVIDVESEAEKHIEEALKNLLHILGQNISVDLESDRAAIYGQYRKKLREKSLEFTNPELLQYWDYENNIIKPSHVYKGSHMKVWWICSKGHKYQGSVNNRVKGIGCPICHGNQVLEGENDFATWCKQNQKEYLLDEWDYIKNSIKPFEITKSPKDMYWWKCPKGHSYQSYVYNRIKGVGCPFCSGKRIIKGFNDLRTLYPNLVQEWDFKRNEKDPSDYTKGSNKKVYWICPQGHNFEAIIERRTSGGGCPYCSGKRVLSGTNDFATEYPDIAAEWDYPKNEIDPTKIKGGSNKRVWWKCRKCGNEWQTSVGNRTSQGTGCPLCSKKKHKR